MLTKILAPIEKLIIEHGSAVVRGDIISLVKEQLGIAHKEISKLEEDNALLRKKVNDLEKFISENLVPKDFIEHRGVLFRRVKGIVSLTDVHCPKCKITMSSLMGEIPFKCSQCGFKAAFSGKDLASITSTISER
jgi:tRNA(Ile2) C34 agmatinyltransferase TiaS